MKNIILTGFMGTGKTTVGRILEKKLNMKFVDTDVVIERSAGIKIAEIFENMGETHFRKLESDAIEMITMNDNQIIATGGGAVINDYNLRLLKESGRVICLKADTDTIINRVCNDSSRPLLKGGDLKLTIENLMQRRMKHYNKADFIVDTDGKSPEDVANNIINYVNQDYNDINVELGDRSYDIKIGKGILNNIGQEMVSLGYDDRAVIITNPEIDRLYGDSIRKSMKLVGIKCETIKVDEGEKSKSLIVADEIITRLLELKCERKTPLIALGGGVVGDLTGFVASIYLRGVPFIQAPTTLLAQVDSSVGGKTGVNHKLGKNLIGAFYQPKIVMIDTDVLSTLPDDEFLNGISEIIKYGVINDADLFEYLKENVDLIMKKDVVALKNIIKRSCEIKAYVVSEDELESGLRAILNFGHTLGHALEATSDYKGIKHGRAIAIGMIFAARLSLKLGICTEHEVDEINNIIKLYGISTEFKIKNVRNIMNAMKLDKKVKDGNINFVLPKSIGKVEYDVKVNEESILSALSSFGQAN